MTLGITRKYHGGSPWHSYIILGSSPRYCVENTMGVAYGTYMCSFSMWYDWETHKAFSSILYFWFQVLPILKTRTWFDGATFTPHYFSAFWHFTLMIWQLLLVNGFGTMWWLYFCVWLKRKILILVFGLLHFYCVLLSIYRFLILTSQCYFNIQDVKSWLVNWFRMNDKGKATYPRNQDV